MVTDARIIHSDPDIMGGTPVFVGTRVPVKTLLDYLEAGDPLDEFLRDFPSVSRAHAVEALKQIRYGGRYISQPHRRLARWIVGTIGAVGSPFAIVSVYLLLAHWRTYPTTGVTDEGALAVGIGVGLLFLCLLPLPSLWRFALGILYFPTFGFLLVVYMLCFIVVVYGE